MNMAGFVGRCKPVCHAANTDDFTREEIGTDGGLRVVNMPYPNHDTSRKLYVRGDFGYPQPRSK